MSSDNKPLITISGNESLVLDQLSAQIARDLPQEGVEWQRSYGRTSKIVYLEAKFVSLSDQHLTTDANELQLLCRPLLHTYWTDCPDVETYKTQTRDDINAWLQRLKERSIGDWFIVHIDNSDARKGLNKSKLLPTIKTSVVDKIRNEFPSNKSSLERTISLLESTRNESKATDSYRQFMVRLRALLLHSYSKQLLLYEDYIRTVRESRNALNWNFFHFFGLQEELAFAFEMLSLYDEALVQYDELDALFSQFVINSNVGQMPDWLSQLCQHYDQWHGLCLASNATNSLRQHFSTGKAVNLIELRNYLFARQSELLFLLNKPWELASRALPFLQNCVNELNILEITITPGGMACWVFLSALEILHKCERYSDSSQMESYSRHTVGLWSYVRNKLSELGSICGLMPGMTITSEHLHRVVDLIAGMGADPRTGEVPMSPQERLKEALSGQEAFLKHYLEISELTMGTYKHIGRMRFARLIGKELAELYIQLERPQKAMPFLLDLEKVYVKEKWPQLLNDIRGLLLKCYQMTNDLKREFKVQCQLSANNLLSAEQRLSHCVETEKLLKNIRETTNDLLAIRMEDIFEIKDLSLALVDNYTVTNREIQLDLCLTNNFPKPIACKQLLVSLRVEHMPSNTNLAEHKTAANGCPHLNEALDANVKPKPNDELLKLNSKPEIETFHSSVSVGVKCNNTNRLLLRRSDSHGFILQDREPEVGDCSQAFVAKDIVLNPGANSVGLKYTTKESGTYVLNQIVLNWDSSANIIGTDIPRHVCFAVIAEEPTLKVLQLTTLDGLTNDILCGVQQSIVLQLNCGSSSFPQNLCFNIKGSHGLQLKLETDLTSDLKDEIQLPLSAPLDPFQTFDIPLVIKSKIFVQKESNSVEHELNMSWTKTTGVDIPVHKWISVTFHLLPPFITAYKLHSCDRRKFIEILVSGVSKRQLLLSAPELRLPEEAALANQLELKPSLPKSDSIIDYNQTVHYLWEILATNASVVTNKVTFRLKYRLFDTNCDNDWQYFDCDYKLTDYQTLYTIKESIEPQNGTEFCRAGSLCHLNVSITRLKSTSDHNSVMYEIVSDQTLWSLCGKTAGVVAIEEQTDNYEVTFEVMPLISGFLPFPTVRLSKYVSAKCNIIEKPVTTGDQSEAKLLAFDVGQVYNWSRGTQIHVLPSSGLIVPEVQ